MPRSLGHEKRARARRVVDWLRSEGGTHCTNERHYEDATTTTTTTTVSRRRPLAALRVGSVAGKREPPPGLEVAPQPRRTVDFEALVDDDDDSDSDDDDPAPIVVAGVDDAAAGDGVECGACGLFLTPEKAVLDAPEHFPDPDEDLEL